MPTLKCNCQSVDHETRFCKLVKADERKLEAFHTSCQRQVLRLCWYQFISNAQTGKTACVAGSTADTWQSLDMFVDSLKMFQCIPHSSLAVKARSGCQPAHWRRSRDRPHHSWTTQIEMDSEHCADLAWDMAGDCRRWRVLRPTAGQADQ